MLQVPWPGLSGSVKEHVSCQTVTNTNSEQPLLGVFGTAALGEGNYWRVNLLQPTEVEFLTLPFETLKTHKNPHSL